MNAVETLTPTTVEAPTRWQEEAGKQFDRAEAILASLGEQLPYWELRFPSNEGHPGLGLKGQDGYSTEQKASLSIVKTTEKTYLTLSAVNKEHIRRPRTKSGSNFGNTGEDRVDFSSLEVAIDPSSPHPFVMYGVDVRGGRHGLIGVSDNDAAMFAAICLTQAEKKQGIEAPSKAAELDAKIAGRNSSRRQAAELAVAHAG